MDNYAVGLHLLVFRKPQNHVAYGKWSKKQETTGTSRFILTRTMNGTGQRRQRTDTLTLDQYTGGIRT